jgi:CRISPR-associated protein Cas1
MATIRLQEQEKEEWFVTNLPYEKLIVSGNGYVSTEAIKSIITKSLANFD